MQFVIAACSFCILFFVFGGVTSTHRQLSLENPDTMLTSLPVCSEDNSVCNILIKNESGMVDEIEQVCTCAHGNLCPSTANKANTIRFLDSEWFVTCASLDRIPACETNQVSLFSQMESLDEPVNFLVKCTCPGGYDSNGALWRLDGTKVLVEIYCNDDQNADEGSADDYGDNIIGFENEGQKEIKRSGDNNAFYKRGHIGNLYSFYKRGGSDVFGFYKRGPNSLQAFYKRPAFYKRAAELRTKVAPSKRSVHYYKTFYKRAPLGDMNAFYKRDHLGDDSLGFDKKNSGLYSFYKRSFDNNQNAFYKRDRLGIDAFYKRALDNLIDLNTAANGDENWSVLDDRLRMKDETSFVNKQLAGPVRLFYKPHTVLSRLPWYRNVGTSVDYGRQDAGSYKH